MHNLTSREDIALEIATLLLEAKAVKLNIDQPFQWASGWKSPIYCDNRLTLSFPHIRTKIKQYLVEEISGHYPAVQGIVGVATAGIPQGALIADMLELPFSYIRSKPKGHGMENLIEGRIEKGQKVVIVEDLVSTGGSSLNAAEAARKAGAEVLGMVSIFTYGFKLAADNFQNANIKLVSLSSYSQLIQVAINSGYIPKTDLPSLQKWQNDPANWV